MGGAVFSRANPGKPLTPADTVVSMSELVDSEHCLVGCGTGFTERPVLKSGPLLKWIDISASMAAGRFLTITRAGSTAVTRSMQSVDFRGSAFLGDVLELTSKLVNVGRTSMTIEVVVTATDSQTQKSHLISVANVAMVALGWTLRGFGPTPAPPLVPSNDADRLKMAELTARRSAKGLDKKTFSPQVWEEFLASSGDLIGASAGDINPADTRTQCIKIAFPEHMNPGGYTFGGNLLSWMHDAAYLCGTKFAKQRKILAASIDEVNFLASSKTTDIITLHCQVNRVFNSSFVVGCRVEKLNKADPEKPIHICSAHFSMVASEPDKLQQVYPQTEEDQWRFYRATVRRANRKNKQE